DCIPARALMDCAVFFNLDGTLIDHDLDYESIFQEAVEEADIEGLEDAYEDYTDRFFRYFQKGWTFPRRQAILDVMKERGVEDLGESDRFAESWEDREAGEAEPLEGAVELVEELSNSHPLGIVTNGTGRLQRMKLEKAGIEELFDSVLISSELGVSKPNAEFFERAREEVEAEEHVIVSNELRRDILPAKREEFLTVWVSEEEGNAQVEQLVDRRVESLEEVPGAVEELCG
ncbi:MAG: HAD family hydrolase, partial [Candidatus Nanohaloarchaea archaeon]|nr:HAD family hydrolase [Candidatus Nanohaloarchaea archaeon]